MRRLAKKYEKFNACSLENALCTEMYHRQYDRLVEIEINAVPITWAQNRNREQNKTENALHVKHLENYGANAALMARNKI